MICDRQSLLIVSTLQISIQRYISWWWSPIWVIVLSCGDCGLQKEQKQPKATSNVFHRTSRWVMSLRKFKKLNFCSNCMVVVALVWKRMEKVRIIRSFGAYGPEKMLDLSKVHDTVVRLNQFFFSLDWVPGQPFDRQTFILTNCLSYLSSS